MDNFIKIYNELNTNLQRIVAETILRMEKNHKVHLDRKKWKLRPIVKFYAAKAGVTYEQIMGSTGIEDNFFKDILKSDRMNIKNNLAVQNIIEFLNIPVDKSGNPYIAKKDIEELYGKEDEDFPEKQYRFRDEYYDYIMEFQSNSVYDNFECLSEANKAAVLYLVDALYKNEICPELFEN